MKGFKTWTDKGRFLRLAEMAQIRLEDIDIGLRGSALTVAPYPPRKLDQ